MATNQYNTGGYGFNPLDPRAQFMTNDLMTRPVTDPAYDSIFASQNGVNVQGGAGQVQTPFFPNANGGVNVQGGAGQVQTPFFPGVQDASWLGGAGGPMNQPAGTAQNQTAPTNGAKPEFTVQGGNYRGPDFNTLLNQAGQQGQGALLDRLRQQYAGYGQNPTDSNNAFNTLGGAETFISSLANGAGQGSTFGNNQRQQAQIDAMLANQLAYGGTSNSHMNQGFLDSLNQNQYQAPREDPFAGQNLNDASVQFQMKQYMQTHPDYVPVNTYKGEAPRLPGEINQDTGMRTMDGVSGQNPWITNRGFVQQMPWQNQPQQAQQQAPQAPQAQQQANPYLQPFQTTNAYNKAMNTNYASQNQPQAQSYWGGQGAFGNGAQNPYSGTSNNNFQSPFQTNSSFGKNQFQMGGQQQSNGGLLGSNPYGGKNRYGLLG